MEDYSAIDQSPLIGFLFYRGRISAPVLRELSIFSSPLLRIFPSQRGFMKKTKAGPGSCIFHGNGEVVRDYDEIAPCIIGRR